MFNFSNIRVLIAGGTSGVGLATAQLLAKLDAQVIITGRDSNKLNEALKVADRNVTGYAFDASSEEEVKKILPQIGKINHLVLALSGGKGGGPFESMQESVLRNAFDAKFWTHFSFTQHCLPYLDQAGSVTFISAISARASNPGTSGLSAMNAAIEGLIKPLAVELRPRRINAVSPGVIDTPWWNWLSEDDKANAFHNFAQSTPVGRVGKPEDIATAIAFLIGNTFVTGTVLEVDGGLHLIGQKL
jgi:NAD(P)-dependent dehydrogenase (short-subunit alcohol dehydrogenase family)